MNRRKKTMATKTMSDTLTGFSLSTDSFPTFYNKLLALRFPIPVAEVLELRDLLNHSVERFEEPTDTPHYREFKESLQAAIHSFGIEEKRYCQRLLRILTMLRGVHYHHSIRSRDTERALRQAQSDNRRARSQSVQYGLFAMLAAVVSGLAWIAMSEPGWLIKLLPLTFALIAWGNFRALPILDREIDALTTELNDELRRRVKTLHWKTLIHKLALILGYKQIPGIEVFRHEHDTGPYPFH